MRIRVAGALAVLALEARLCLGIYRPLLEYNGRTFFDRWSYWGNVDNTTWGNVTYADYKNATDRQLVSVNDNGNAVIRVDNFSTLQPAELVNRESVRITSIDTYHFGTLIIIDAVHIPYGCSVWPAFWTLGVGKEWPEAGEIDIIEAVNNMPNNQIAVHTIPGCMQAEEPGQTGVTLDRNCSTGRGCMVAETKPNSFGRGFAEAGGGVWALQMEATGFYIWFWSRADIPANVREATSSTPIATEGWGIPTAAYPSGPHCDLSQYFGPQQLVLLTTLCGAWAGVPDIYQSTCQTPTGSCFADNVLGPPSNFDQAYWEIRYIRTYLSDTAAPSSPSSLSSSSTGPSRTQSFTDTSYVPTVTGGASNLNPLDSLFLSETFVSLSVLACSAFLSLFILVL